MATTEVTIEAVGKANREWSKRALSEVNDLQLDHEADILYLTFGDPEEALSVPVDANEDDVYLRVEPETLKIVGLDIHGFRLGFLQRHSDAKEAFAPLFNILGDMDWRIQLKLPAHDDDKGQHSPMLPSAYASLAYFPNYLPKAAPALAAA